MVIASRAGHVALAAAALAVASLPLVASQYALQLASTALVSAMFALSLQILVGGAGMVSLGQAGFFGLGAYAVFLLAPDGTAPSCFVSLPMAALLGGTAALLVGALAVRTRTFYFLMTTLAFGQMFFFLFHDTPLGGGADGVFVARPAFSLFGFELEVARRDRPAASLFTNLAILVGMYALAVWFMRTLYGHALLGVKANEHRMRSLGFDTYRLKLGAFVLAGAMAGVAGHQAAMTDAYVSPDLLSWHRSAEALLMVLLGGIGALHGPILGAFAYVGLAEAAQMITERQRLVQGIVILACELALRGGLAGIRWRRLTVGGIGTGVDPAPTPPPGPPPPGGGGGGVAG
jgi:branched-chain amino acid transport system permease protein